MKDSQAKKMSCGLKSRFNDRQTARQAMNEITKSEDGLIGIPYCVYHCTNCDGWHIGHRAKGRKHIATLKAFSKNNERRYG